MFFITTFLYILVAILVFGVLILTHELGHFIAAKACHMKVNEFAVGMGPAIFKIKRGETTYALRCLPIGGFCAMEGEDDESDDERSFRKRPVWQRMIVSLAGATVNLLTGFIIILIITSTGNAIGTNIISKFDNSATSNAESGLKIGDEIIKINGSRVHVNNDIMYDLILDKDGDVSMQVKRNGTLVDLPKVSFPMADDGNGGKVMRVDFWVLPQAKTVLSVLHESFYQTISMVRLVWLTFFSLFNGRFGLSDLAGPIGTTAAVGQAASQGISTLLFVTAMIAVNLGVVNLFPLPALDGGMFFMLIIEAIRKKPVKAKYQGFVNFIGFALLMVLMVVVSFNDIVRLIKG